MLIQQLSMVVFTMVVLLSFIDFKRVVLFWLPAQLLFNAQVALRYAPPALSLQIGVNIYLLIYYIVYSHVNRKNTGLRENFPLWRVSVFILSSYIFSTIFGQYGTLRGMTLAIKYFVTDIGTVFLTFKMVQSDKDLKFFVRSSAFVFTIIIALGISEFVLQDNLWADFVYIGSPHDETTEGRMYYIPPFLGGSYQMRYGLIRAISTFGIHISFGAACVVYFWLFLQMKVRNFKYISNRWATFFALMILMGVFLCNSKTGMVGLFFLLISLFSLKQLITPKYAFIFFVCLSIMLIFVPEYFQNIVSLFDSDVAEEGGGSSVELRQQQFVAAQRMFMMNPIFGNGIGSLDILKKIGDNSDILGAESVWMQILPERGMYGMIAHCYLYVACYKYFRHVMPVRILLFYLLAIFVMSTATGEITMVYWGVVLFVSSKMFIQRKEYY